MTQENLDLQIKQVSLLIEEQKQSIVKAHVSLFKTKSYEMKDENVLMQVRKDCDRELKENPSLNKLKQLHNYLIGCKELSEEN